MTDVEVTVKKRQQSNPPRRHHYVPAFLLQGFTPSGQRDDALWVHDQKQRKAWQAKPDQAAWERDYYRVDLPDVEPTIVETALGTIESRAAAIIQEVARARELPNGEELEALVSFVTLLALRTPSFRGIYEQNTKHFYRHTAKMLLSRPEPFEQFVKDQCEEGKTPPPEVTYEAMRRFIEDESGYDIVIPRTDSVQMLLTMWQSLLPVFSARRWSLFFTKPEEGHIICSDAPVSITPTRPDSRLRFLGFGLKETELTVPISRSLALVGSYETPSMTAQIPLTFVRLINRRTISFAERFLYSADKSLLR